jgi:hypothetical protein
MMAMHCGLRDGHELAKRAIVFRQMRESDLPRAIVWGKEEERVDRPALLLRSPRKASFFMESSASVRGEKPSSMARETARSAG